MSRRVVEFEGVKVYAPICKFCKSDDRTRWEELPPLETIRFGGQATCRACCVGTFGVDAVDCFRAREPERLEARLAEVKAGGWR